MPKPEITFDDFQRLDLRVGTVLNVKPNPKAKKSAYVLTIDFGPEIGSLTSSAQLTENYTPEGLTGRQVVAAVNFPRKLIAGIRSECLVLGAVSPEKGVMLLGVDQPVENGTGIG